MKNTSTLFLQGISIKKDSPKSGFPFSIPAISDLDLKIKKPITFLVGENGSGKSTILEALADRIGNSMEIEGKSQLIVATHSPLLLAYPNADIFLLDESGISPVNYEDTEHYQITKSFLDNPSAYFKLLFE